MSIKLKKILSLQENWANGSSTVQSAWTLLTPTTSRQPIQTFRFSNPLCLVNLNLLAEALWCNKCDLPLSLKSCLEEKSWQDSTFLKINCSHCHHPKCILLCNEDPEDDAYINPLRSDDMSDLQALCGTNRVDLYWQSKLISTFWLVPKEQPDQISDGNVPIKRIKNPKKAEIDIQVTKGKRGRPRGSKNKTLVKPPKKPRTEKAVVEEDFPLLQRIKIIPSVEPPEDCTSAFFEAEISDGGNESTE